MVEVKEGLPEAPVLVALLGDRLGHEIKKPGASFRMSNIYDHEPMAGNDVFTRVYFRTDSGNIYSLDTNGNLVNAKESQRKGAIVQNSLKKEELKQQKLTIGEPFSYDSPDNTGRTSRITEIVPVVEHRVYIPDVLRQITSGRTNTIRADFQKLMPPQKMGERNNRDLEGLVGPEDLEQLIRTRAGIPPKAEKKPQVSPLPTVNLAKEPMRAKGNEVPRVKTGPTKPEAQNIEGNDLELKAAELARATREQGMGKLFVASSSSTQMKLGFPQRVYDLGNDIKADWNDILHFIKGQDIPNDDPFSEIIGSSFSIAFVDSAFRWRETRYNNKKDLIPDNRQVWVSVPYLPPIEVINQGGLTGTIRNKLLGRGKDVPRLHNIENLEFPDIGQFDDFLQSYHDKKDSTHYWTFYSYYTRINDPNNPYAALLMSIAVPPNIAKQVDAQVANNAYFPDVFFRKLYPDLIGADTERHIQRKQSTELVIIDLRNRSPDGAIREPLSILRSLDYISRLETYMQKLLMLKASDKKALGDDPEFRKDLEEAETETTEDITTVTKNIKSIATIRQYPQPIPY